jgi:hypothetical protein
MFMRRLHLVGSWRYWRRQPCPQLALHHFWDGTSSLSSWLSPGVRQDDGDKKQKAALGAPLLKSSQ